MFHVQKMLRESERSPYSLENDIVQTDAGRCVSAANFITVIGRNKRRRKFVFGPSRRFEFQHQQLHRRNVDRIGNHDGRRRSMSGRRCVAFISRNEIRTSRISAETVDRRKKMSIYPRRWRRRRCIEYDDEPNRVRPRILNFLINGPVLIAC